MILRMFILAACLLLLPVSVDAGSRYIIEGLNVSAGSGLTNRMEVELSNNQMTKVFVKGVSAGGGQRILAIACLQPDGDVFLDTLTDSAQYSLYKVNISDTGRQALFIFGFSEDLGGSTRTVNEARIIATNELGTIVSHKVRGFSPIVILKTPMQLDSDKELIFVEPDGAAMVFKYDAAKSDFVFEKKS